MILLCNGMQDIGLKLEANLDGPCLGTGVMVPTFHIFCITLLSRHLSNIIICKLYYCNQKSILAVTKRAYYNQKSNYLSVHLEEYVFDA